jgi:integrase
LNPSIPLIKLLTSAALLTSASASSGPALARALQTHKLASAYSSPSDYVFASQVGTPLYWRNVARPALHPALKNAGIEHLRWHDLRHTYASPLIAQGANIVYVSRQLGHGSSDITLRCYSHLFDRAEHAVRTRDALERSFGALL